MISDGILDKYPRVREFLRKHPKMDLDSALVYTENLLSIPQRGGLASPPPQKKGE